jgi:hypothetical protein
MKSPGLIPSGDETRVAWCANIFSERVIGRLTWSFIATGSGKRRLVSAELRASSHASTRNLTSSRFWLLKGQGFEGLEELIPSPPSSLSDWANSRTCCNTSTSRSLPRTNKASHNTRKQSSRSDDKENSTTFGGCAPGYQ